MRRAALALLLLLAAPAEGAIIYMAPTALGSGDGSSAANAKNWFLNVNTWSAGDVVRLVDGTYTSVMIPSVSGSAGSRVTIEGNIANPAAVNFTGGLTITNVSHLTVKGIQFGASCSVNFQSDEDSILYCRQTAGGFNIVGGADNLTIANCNMSLTQFRILCGNSTGSDNGCAFNSNNGQHYGAKDNRPHGLMFSDNVLSITGGGNEAILYITGAINADFRFNRFSLNSNSTVDGTFWWQIKHSFNQRWRGNYVTFSGTNNQGRVFSMRDSTMYIYFDRDTMISSAVNGGIMMMSQAGSTDVRFQRVVVVDSCYISMNRSGGWDWGAIHWQNQTHQYQITNSIVENVGNGLAWFATNSTDSSLVRQNTFRTTGNAAVVHAGYGAGGAHRNMLLTRNIFVTGRFDSTNGAQQAIAHLYSPSTGTVIDSNLYYSTIYGRPTPGRYIVSDGDVFYNPLNSSSGWWAAGRDRNSNVGTPLFADSSTTLGTVRNYRPTSGTYALWPAGWYAGAVDPNSSPPIGDTEPPGAVNDLSGAALTPTRIVLSWTAPGDDGFVGVPASVVVKRHSSQINNESAWSAATTVATLTGGSLSSGGEQQTYDVSSGLSASTTYWFAVRGTDEVPNTGSISNSISVTTPASPDVTAPDPVASLSAQALTPTSIRVTWTATGDNGATGQAANYRLKRRVGTTFVLADSAAATAVSGLTSPKTAGQTESFVIGGLSANTAYAFALWVADVAGNTSTISNAATATTFANPSIAVNTGSRRRRR